ncbi:unnamed protein product, partial [Acanthoscelides obtectus]
NTGAATSANVYGPIKLSCEYKKIEGKEKSQVLPIQTDCFTLGPYIGQKESNFLCSSICKVMSPPMEEEVPHHTFPLASERNIHAVIRGVHATLSEIEIKEELQQRGYPPCT